MDQTDKDHILRTNQYYIAQVSSMEIKISELKAQLHAKDFEIDYYQANYLHQSQFTTKTWKTMN